jgi:hypothetical protein
VLWRFAYTGCIRNVASRPSLNIIRVEVRIVENPAGVLFSIGLSILSLRTMLYASTLLFFLAGCAAAAPPSRRQSEDNGSCQAVQKTCAKSVKSDLSNAWNIKACVLGATCFGGHRPVDGFLAAVYSQKGGKGTAPKASICRE